MTIDIKQDFRQITAFTIRNIKLFFKDKGTLIGALISPLMIMMLYALFLHRVFLQSFDTILGDFSLTPTAINGLIASYEVSSVLAVCCVTVAFVANMCMVSDKVTGARSDLTVTPAKGYILTLGYYFATAIVTLIINYITMAAGLCYIAGMGWAMTATQTFAVMADVLLTTLFSTAFSSCICFFLKSNGAISAVSTIVSSTYGFISGAYYPVSQFSSGIANTVMCLPGTYCTGLFRSHFVSGYEKFLTEQQIPQPLIDGLFEGFDVKIKFFGNTVPVYAMYIVVICTVIALVAAFITINAISKKRTTKV